MSNKKSVAWKDDYELPTFMCVESSMPSPTRVTLSNERKGDDDDGEIPEHAMFKGRPVYLTRVVVPEQDRDDDHDDGSPKPMDISGGGVD
jgi:hypothetical protein